MPKGPDASFVMYPLLTKLNACLLAKQAPSKAVIEVSCVLQFDGCSQGDFTLDMHVKVGLLLGTEAAIMTPNGVCFFFSFCMPLLFATFQGLNCLWICHRMRDTA